MAATALCVASCNDSAGDDEGPITEYKTQQNVLRFETKPDGTQTVTEENVESALPDPVARLVEKDSTGSRWIKIAHDPVPFADGTKDTTGLLREYAYINLDSNDILSQERFESAQIKLTQTADTVYWHPASPYSFDGFWSDQAELNKDEAMQIHEQNINAMTLGALKGETQTAGTQNSGQSVTQGASDTLEKKTTGASGDWSTDSVQTKPVQTRSGGHGGYVFARSYYPYAYHNYGSSPAATHPISSSPIAGSGNNKFSTQMRNTNRFTTMNLFRSRALTMTTRIHPKTFHFTTKMRTPVVRGHFSSRGVSFGT